jgi:MFS family permease
MKGSSGAYAGMAGTALVIEQGGQGRLARRLVIATVVLALLGSSAPSPLYGFYQDRWHFAATVLTEIYTAYSLGTLTTLLVIGRISDRLGDRRSLLLFGLGAVAVGAVIMATAGSVAALLVGRVFAGFGTGAVMGPATAALVELDPMRDGKKAAVIATVAITAGGTLGPILTGAALALNAAPGVTPYIVLAIAAVVTAICLSQTAWPAKPPPAVQMRTGIPAHGFGRTLRNAGLPYIIACAGMALAWMVGGTFVGLGPTFARHLIGVHSAALAGLTVSAFQVVAGASQLLCRSMTLKRLLVGGAILMGLSLLLCTLAAAMDSAALFCLGTLSTGAGFGCAFAGSAALASRSAPLRSRATLVSLAYAVGYIGNLLPVVALGAIADDLGLFDAMAACALATTIGAAGIAAAAARMRGVSTD